MAFAKIYVGSLAWKTTDDDLRRYFQSFGEVVDAFIIYEPSTGNSKGFGFVTFRTAESAARALVNRNPMIAGRKVKCEYAKNYDQPNKQNVSSMGFAKIFVGDLSLETTANDLGRYFQQFGEVFQANIVLQSYPSGESKGYGFVTFRDAESAAKVLEIRNHVINGKMTYCKPKTDQPKQYQPTPDEFLWDPNVYYQKMMQQNDQGNTVIVGNEEHGHDYDRGW